MDALCLGKLRQKQQTRFALGCARSQGLNMAIKHPFSSFLPPAARGAGSPRELVLGEESREAGGFPALP